MTLAGFYTQELRQERGGRTGFDVVTLDGHKAPLARLNNNGYAAEFSHKKSLHEPAEEKPALGYIVGLLRVVTCAKIDNTVTL